MTESEAWAELERRMWGEALPLCPHCGGEGATYLEPHNRVSRKTRTGAPSQRRVWSCWTCRKQFSVMTGTFMHGSKISPVVWLDALDHPEWSHMEISRRHGVFHLNARLMMQKIRSAPSSERGDTPGSDPGVTVR